METKKRNIARVKLMAKCALRNRKPVKAHGAFQLFFNSKHSHDSISSFNKVRYGTLRRTVVSFRSISKCSHTVRSMVTPGVTLRSGLFFLDMSHKLKES